MGNRTAAAIRNGHFRRAKGTAGLEPEATTAGADWGGVISERCFLRRGTRRIYHGAFILKPNLLSCDPFNWLPWRPINSQPMGESPPPQRGRFDFAHGGI